MSEMIKLGLPGVEGSIWDEGGKTSIVQIFISHRRNGIDSIQFSYNIDGRCVLSDTFGDPIGLNFNTVVIDGPLEFLTSISGTYMDGILDFISFHTNKKSHGPFGKINGERLGTIQRFNYEFGPMCGDVRRCCFGGFHGTVLNSCVNSIGVYVKPLETPPTPALPLEPTLFSDDDDDI